MAQIPGVLVLGSFPSRQSLGRHEYYGNPQNHFWKIVEALFKIDHTVPYGIRISLLTAERIALWDVVSECMREGSGDDRIQEPVYNDIAGFLASHPTIQLVLLNGGAAGKFYHALGDPGRVKVPAIVLPSTSPRNARYSLAEKVRRWELLRTGK